MWETVTASFGNVADLVMDKTMSNENKSAMDGNVNHPKPGVASGRAYYAKNEQYTSAQQKMRMISELSLIKTEPDLDENMMAFAGYASVSGPSMMYPVKIESDFHAGNAIMQRKADHANASTAKSDGGIVGPTYGYSPEAIRRFNPDMSSITSALWESKVPVVSTSKIRRPSKPRRSAKQNKKEINTQSELEAELADIATLITRSNKSASELLQEFGPRLKKIWKASRTVSKKPWAKTKADRMREYRRWIKSLGEAGNPIARVMADRAAEYTRNRRERIKILAQAGDPAATVMFARLLENRRRYIERRRALREAGGPVAEAMAERAREYTRKRTHRIKVMAEAGDPAAKAKLARILESRKRYTERRRALREAGGLMAKCVAEAKVLTTPPGNDPLNARPEPRIPRYSHEGDEERFMDQRLTSTVRDLPPEQFRRGADLTMDVMIPDEIKSEMMSATNLDRQKTNMDTRVKFKAVEETAMAGGRPSDGEPAVKVEPLLNAYMTNLIEYGTRKEVCAVKTGPTVDVSMTNVSEGTDSGMKCEDGLTFPVKVESGVGVRTTENQSRMHASMAYPIKMESELDLSAEILKHQGAHSVGDIDTIGSHFLADPALTAARRLGSISAENIPVAVLPNMYPPATALAQCPVPAAAARFVPDKMVSNMSDTVKKVMDSTVKRLCSAKFGQNVRGCAASVLDNEMSSSIEKDSLRSVCDHENRAHPGFRNPCQVSSNVPAGMRSTGESYIKSQMKTPFPMQFLPHLPLDPNSMYQAQSQAGLKRIVPVKTAQHMPAAETSMASDLMESPLRRFMPDRITSMSTEVSVMSPAEFGVKPKSFRKPRKEKLEVKKDVDFEIVPVNPAGVKNSTPARDQSLNDIEIPDMPHEVAAELTVIARAMKSSNKTAAELVREHGARVKELWKACSTAFRKPGVKSKTNRRQEFKAWVMSAGEPGIYIMKTIAKSVADYTRKRREKIKQLAEAGDPVAMEVFSRVLENRRKFIERRRALREAGGPAAMAMAQRARERERMRRARKALLKSGNYCRDSV